MKNLLCLTVCALSLLAFASTARGAEANGDFDFDLAGATGVIVFDGGVNNDGVVRGEMSFSATVDVSDPDGGTIPLTLTVGVQFDCMVAAGNRAAMSGVISSANVPGYVGQQALLVVEDQVEGVSPTRDAFSWGVYQPTTINWIRNDEELCPAKGENGESLPCNADPGEALTWVTADAELYPCPPPTEENPNPSCPADPNGYTTGLSTIPTVVSCDSFPLAAYPLNLIPQGGGNKVEVKSGA